eukprot:11890886-Heterocapsa_arctica.AAC.1
MDHGVEETENNADVEQDNSDSYYDLADQMEIDGAARRRQLDEQFAAIAQEQLQRQCYDADRQEMARQSQAHGRAIAQEALRQREMEMRLAEVDYDAHRARS